MSLKVITRDKKFIKFNQIIQQQTMDLSKLFLLICYVGITVAKCTIKLEPGMPNRTICTVDKLTEDSPIKFQKQKTPDFLYLDVSYGEIPKDAFQKLKSKKELWFLGENITYIQPGAFRNLTDLDNLAITNTLISTISPNTFTGLPNLKILSLINNQINLIEDDGFNGLGNLQQLLLKENQLRRINESTFHGLENLQVLDLDDNPIEYIHENAFRGMTKLTRLVISLVNDVDVDQKALSFLSDNQKIVHYIKQ